MWEIFTWESFLVLISPPSFSCWSSALFVILALVLSSFSTSVSAAASASNGAWRLRNVLRSSRAEEGSCEIRKKVFFSLKSGICGNRSRGGGGGGKIGREKVTTLAFFTLCCPPFSLLSDPLSPFLLENILVEFHQDFWENMFQEGGYLDNLMSRKRRIPLPGTLLLLCGDLTKQRRNQGGGRGRKGEREKLLGHSAVRLGGEGGAQKKSKKSAEQKKEEGKR